MKKDEDVDVGAMEVEVDAGPGNMATEKDGEMESAGSGTLARRVVSFTLGVASTVVIVVRAFFDTCSLSASLGVFVVVAALVNVVAVSGVGTADGASGGLDLLSHSCCLFLHPTLCVTPDPPIAQAMQPGSCTFPPRTFEVAVQHFCSGRKGRA
jgi:hypothetical protein